MRAATVTLRGPQRPGGSLSPVTVNVVQVREVDPPPDDEPVEWLLVTTLPIATAEQVREVPGRARRDLPLSKASFNFGSCA